MAGPEQRARLVVEDFERWKASICKCSQEVMYQARTPLVSLLVQFVRAVDSRRNGDGEKTLVQLSLLSNAVKNSVDDGDFERFFRDFMLEFLAAMRRDRKLVAELAKEVFRRLNEWPGGML